MLHARWPLLALVLVATAGPGASGCHRGADVLVVSQGETFAEMRAIKGDVTVTPAGRGAARRPTPASASSKARPCTLAAGGLAWIRRDAGAVLLVAGPARPDDARRVGRHDRGARLRRHERRAAGDGSTRRKAIARAVRRARERRGARRRDARRSTCCAAPSAAGSSVRAGPGERLTLAGDGTSARAPGAGVGRLDGRPRDRGPGRRAGAVRPRHRGRAAARRQGQAALLARRAAARRARHGRPRLRRHRGRRDLRQPGVRRRSRASSASARRRARCCSASASIATGTSSGARVKESAAAQAQYESNVYQGSTEDPALLQWTAPGVYSARLYPIKPGAQRRVVTRYSRVAPAAGAARRPAALRLPDGRRGRARPRCRASRS